MYAREFFFSQCCWAISWPIAIWWNLCMVIRLIYDCFGRSLLCYFVCFSLSSKWSFWKKRELFPIRLVETALFFASICFLNDFFLLAIYCLWAKPSSCCFLLQFRNFCIGPKNSWTTTTKPKSPTKTENGTKLKREVLVFIRIFAIRSTSLNWI